MYECRLEHTLKRDEVTRSSWEKQEALANVLAWVTYCTTLDKWELAIRGR